jgi:general secretion pathway protein C
MLKRYFWLARLLLVTLIAVLAADITKSYISAKLATPLAQRPPQASGTPNRPAQTAAANYQVISTRNIFNANPPKEALVPEKPPEPPPVIKEIQVTQLQLKLVGTVAGTSGRRYVIIEDLSKRGAQAVYQIGDTIQSAVIAEISPMCVLLDRGDGPYESLCFQQDGETKADTRTAARPPPAAPPPPAASRNADEGIVQVDPGTWRLSRELLMEQLSNFATLSTQAQFMPYTVQGQPQGTRITRLTPGSMLQKIGLQTGDILQKMNGISMNSPEEALRAFQQLQSEATVRLDVLRQNRATTLTYELR